MLIKGLTILLQQNYLTLCHLCGFKNVFTQNVSVRQKFESHSNMVFAFCDFEGLRLRLPVSNMPQLVVAKLTSFSVTGKYKFIASRLDDIRLCH